MKKINKLIVAIIVSTVFSICFSSCGTNKRGPVPCPHTSILIKYTFSYPVFKARKVYQLNNENINFNPLNKLP